VHALILENEQRWRYETDDFTGVCEIANDEMTVKCVFQAVTNRFYDVLKIDELIRHRLSVPVSVERLAEVLAGDFPGVSVTVSGRAKTHGWITSGVFHRHIDK
jgi:hypothetical protein